MTRPRLYLVSALLFCAMGFYVPWKTTVDVGQVRMGVAGPYAAIASPPPANEFQDKGLNEYASVSVDFGRLLVGWAALAVLTLAASRFVPKE